jgi:enediyne biosynthesis protein E4
MTRGSLAPRWGAIAVLAALASACERAPTPQAPAAAASAAAASAPAAATAPPLFIEVAQRSGVDFRHVNGMSGEFHYAEIIGSGIALFDYDNDGRLDLLVLQGKPLAQAGDSGPCLARLYHNDGGSGAALRLRDVTEKSGLCSRGYGMGVAVGDIDNDGCVDVFITHFGSANQLFRNRCDGRFEDVTKKAGVAGAGRWGASATFFDFDRDGRLDLYVANYIDYTLADKKKCFSSAGLRDYCAPSSYRNVPGHLYRNLGNARFADVSEKSGITRAFGAGLGVMALDLTGDAWPDLFVANDGNPNQLWINQRDGTFKDEALLRGSAVNAQGAAEAGMGLDIGDFDNNGTEDIFMTHLAREKSTMFVNRGAGQFEDRSIEVGVALPSLPYTGFGTAFIDYDNDGWLDVVAANGEVRLIEELRAKGDPYPLHQKKQLFHNQRNGRLTESTAQGGPAFELSEVGRGLAAGDIDNDGAIDFVVSNNKGPLRIFMNNASEPQAWLGLRLLTGKRDAHGARIEIERKGAPTLWRRVRADGSYLSANDPRLLVGLGKASEVVRLTVLWPDGRTETFPAPALRRYTTLKQGTTGAARQP